MIYIENWYIVDLSPTEDWNEKIFYRVWEEWLIEDVTNELSRYERWLR